ncbi:MAG TPA: hypothetical protein PLF35_02810, partial [Prolixibacteraceae bacterium]|nr:hypothetical protein [Prolixibacteraceae bacterium]
SQFWLDSLINLEKLLPQTDVDNLIMKAEINRQLGFFEESISFLADTDNSIGQKIIAEALLQNRKPFIL